MILKHSFHITCLIFLVFLQNSFSTCSKKILENLTLHDQLTDRLLLSQKKLNFISEPKFTVIKQEDAPNFIHKDHSNVTPVFIKMNNKTYFMKVLKKGEAVIEASKFQFLNDIKLGPKLIGLINLTKGRIGIVTEIVEGALLKCCILIGAREYVTRNTIQQIRKIGKKLESYNIDAEDIQFIIKRDGTPVLIDPGEFKFLKGENKLTWTPELGYKNVELSNNIFEKNGLKKLSPYSDEFYKVYYPNYEVMAKYLESLLEDL